MKIVWQMKSDLPLNIIIVRWLYLPGMQKSRIILKPGVATYYDRGVGRYFTLERRISLITERKWDVYWIWLEIKIIIILTFSVMFMIWLHYKTQSKIILYIYLVKTNRNWPEMKNLNQEWLNNFSCQKKPALKTWNIQGGKCQPFHFWNWNAEIIRYW